MSLTLGPFHFVSASGGIEDLAAGRERTYGLAKLDDRLPQPNSLRRAGEDTKSAVLAATELLRAEGIAVSDRIGLYVGHHITLRMSREQFLRVLNLVLIATGTTLIVRALAGP